MSSGRSTEDLRARLQSLRQSSPQRLEPVRDWGDTFQLDELEDLQSTPGGSASSSAEEEYADVWRDTRPTRHSYVDDQPIERQLSYGLNPAVEETYEAAFRLIQLAAEAERGGHPLQAIELYTDAGEVLIKVGRGEPDPLLKQGIREKANEVMKRAEELDEWYYSVQESARKAALPPQLQIQRTQVPRVQEAWRGRSPTLSQAPELTHMRYTAVSTKDPVKFSDDGFQLRVEEAGKKIRVFVTITMYNEQGSELQGTLTGIAKNLEFMAEQWGDRAWESVAVAVVSDGRTKASASCLDFLTGLGAFDEEIMTVTSVGVDVQLHLFEATVQLVRDDNFESFYPPIQLMYALKEKNAGKLNSHLWFFNAFSEQLLPTYTVLVDVGTIPGPSSIFKLIRSMDRNPQIGGVAGEIAVDHPNYFNPVIAAQHFEYKISNLMDKSLESVLGFISVLPGAFSAYRYEAIRAEKGAGPLPEYFKSLTTSTRDLGPFKGNMYLAEDRILCFELLARRGRNWTMHYVKDAIARTDVPETLVDLIKQRRRWLNGSFFAGLFAISNFSRVWKESGHSLSRKIVLTLQFIYLSVQSALSWFLLSNLFLTFYYVLTLTLYSKYPALLAIVLGIYLAIVGGIVVFALGNRPEKRTAAFYSFSYVFMGLVMLVVSVISIYGLVEDVSVTDPRDDLASCSVSNFELVGGVVTAIGLVFASAFIHGEFSVLLGTLQYYFMLPTFVNILGIYAYSNLHDLSWGTKGLETAGHGASKVPQGTGNLKEIVAQQKRLEAEKQRAAQEREDVDNSFRAFRSSLLLFWLVTNAVWMYCMTNLVSSSCYLKFISYVVAVFNVVRFLGSAVFLCFRVVRRLGTCGASRSGSVGRNYQAHLPAEWQAHYKRSSNATTDSVTVTTGNGHLNLNISDLSFPAATNYKNMDASAQ
ncbi:Chitin synthase [Phytophthora rubi]|uniref:chitin synthase n=1 Tax=Phytophthora rubi TaxID=129364 RepID=A0A6A3MRJ8_9STRA|nr:Chitin synthase [Phytophthora rubi]KAE9033664.1 Chitin synthase [Phytophthora rubi]KAE9340584.1 Chitin synthase [Phytophthora rubi]